MISAVYEGSGEDRKIVRYDLTGPDEGLEGKYEDLLESVSEQRNTAEMMGNQERLEELRQLDLFIRGQRLDAMSKSNREQGVFEGSLETESVHETGGPESESSHEMESGSETKEDEPEMDVDDFAGGSLNDGDMDEDELDGSEMDENNSDDLGKLFNDAAKAMANRDMDLDGTALRTDEEIKKREEEERERLRQKKEEEALKRLNEEEEQRKKKEEEDRKRAEAEEAQRKAKEEEARKRAEAEEQRRRKEEEDRLKRENEERERQEAEEKKRQQSGNTLNPENATGTDFLQFTEDDQPELEREEETPENTSQQNTQQDKKESEYYDGIDPEKVPKQMLPYLKKETDYNPIDEDPNFGSEAFDRSFMGFYGETGGIGKKLQEMGLDELDCVFINGKSIREMYENELREKGLDGAQLKSAMKARFAADALKDGATITAVKDFDEKGNPVFRHMNVVSNIDSVQKRADKLNRDSRKKAKDYDKAAAAWINRRKDFVKNLPSDISKDDIKKESDRWNKTFQLIEDPLVLSALGQNLTKEQKKELKVKPNELLTEEGKKKLEDIKKLNNSIVKSLKNLEAAKDLGKEEKELTRLRDMYRDLHNKCRAFSRGSMLNDVPKEQLPLQGALLDGIGGMIKGTLDNSPLGKKFGVGMSAAHLDSIKPAQEPVSKTEPSVDKPKNEPEVKKPEKPGNKPEVKEPEQPKKEPEQPKKEPEVKKPEEQKVKNPEVLQPEQQKEPEKTVEQHKKGNDQPTNDTQPKKKSDPNDVLDRIDEMISRKDGDDPQREEVVKTEKPEKIHRSDLNEDIGKLVIFRDKIAESIPEKKFLNKIFKLKDQNDFKRQYVADFDDYIKKIKVVMHDADTTKALDKKQTDLLKGYYNGIRGCTSNFIQKITEQNANAKDEDFYNLPEVENSLHILDLVTASGANAGLQSNVSAFLGIEADKKVKIMGTEPVKQSYQSALPSVLAEDNPLIDKSLQFLGNEDVKKALLDAGLKTKMEDVVSTSKLVTYDITDYKAHIGIYEGKTDDVDAIKLDVDSKEKKLSEDIKALSKKLDMLSQELEGRNDEKLVGIKKQIDDYSKKLKESSVYKEAVDHTARRQKLDAKGFITSETKADGIQRDHQKTMNMDKKKTFQSAL